MELLTNQFPSDYDKYEFPTVTIKPFTFKEITEYLEGLPKEPLAKFIYEIKWLKKTDPNIGKLLIVDIPYVIFLKHAHTISKDLNFHTKISCPVDKSHEIGLPVKLSQLEFSNIPKGILFGFEITFASKVRELVVRTVDEFIQIATRYINNKDNNSLKIIRLISLFKDYDRSPNDVENMVVNATHDDITTLQKLDDLYFKKLKPVKTFCHQCNEGKPESERRHLLVDIDSIIDNPFRDILENCISSANEVLFEQIRKSR